MRVVRLCAAVLLAVILTIPVLLVALFCNEYPKERMHIWLRKMGMAPKPIHEPAQSESERNYQMLRNDHWSHGPEALIVVRAKDIPVGTNTYAGLGLDAALSERAGSGGGGGMA